MKRAYLEQACEEVDAAVFSGDVLYDPEDRAALLAYIGRWTRAIEAHDENILGDCAEGDEAEV